MLLKSYVYIRAVILASKDKETFFTLSDWKTVLTQKVICRIHPPFLHVLLEVSSTGGMSVDC